MRWCAQWWSHAEAYARAEALLVGRREAEAAGRLLPWWRDADAAMSVLTDPAGTFSACTPERHHPPSRLPSEIPPAHYYTEETR